MGKDSTRLHRHFHTENEEESGIKERPGMASEGRWSMCLEWGAFGSHKRQKKAGGKIKGKKQSKKRHPSPPPPQTNEPKPQVIAYHKPWTSPAQKRQSDSGAHCSRESLVSSDARNKGSPRWIGSDKRSISCCEAKLTTKGLRLNASQLSSKYLI